MVVRIGQFKTKRSSSSEILTAAVLSGFLMASQPAFAITGLADKSSALEVLPVNHYRWKLQTAA